MQKATKEKQSGEAPRFPRKLTKGTLKKTGRGTFRRKAHPMKTG